MACYGKNGPTYGVGELVLYSKFNESDNLKSMTEMKPYHIPIKDGRNQLTNMSSDNVTVGDLEVWAVKFSEAFESEYSMQWLDEKYVTPAELMRRE